MEFLPDITPYSSIINIIVYIIVMLVGGVIYKFYELWTKNQQSSNKELIDNLFKSIEAANVRISKLEIENQEQSKFISAREEQFFKEQLRLVQQLALSESKVEILENKVSSLEQTQKQLTVTIESLEKHRVFLEKNLKEYQNKFGLINEAS